MLREFSHLMPSVYNQTDRIQGMARYMNKDGSSSEWMNLALIFAGMLTIILILKMVARAGQKKREKEKRIKAAKKKAAIAKAQKAAHGRSRQGPVKRSRPR